jgi:hypothetical protein
MLPTGQLVCVFHPERSTVHESILGDPTTGFITIPDLIVTGTFTPPSPFSLTSILLADGSAAAPSLAFTTEATTGLYHPSPADLRISLGGTFGFGFQPGVFTINSATATLSMSTAGDLFVLRDDANTLALRNGTTAQLLRLYRTYTSSTNFERLVLGCDATTRFLIGTEAGGGGGTQRTLDLFGSQIRLMDTTGNTVLWRTDSINGHLLTGTDNAWDIGASGATRPRSIYLGNITPNAFTYGTTGGQLTSTAAATDGQLLIGRTGDVPVAASLTAGAGVTITPGAGSITIASTSSVLDRVSANVTVGNTTSETDLYSFSVPGGTLSTDRRLRLTLFCRNTDDFSANSTLRLKYGATTLVTLTASGAGALTAAHTRITYELTGDGATNAQVAQGFYQVGPTAGGNGALTQDWIMRGTSAIDSTSAQTLAVSWQWSLGSAGNSFVMESAILEVL